MWIEPLWRWEEGELFHVHRHLRTYIRNLAYYTNEKRWKQARVVPWLFRHLGAVLYQMEHRSDLVKLSTLLCRHVYDAFIEHLASVFKHLMPINTALTPELVNAPVPSSNGAL